MSRLLLTGIGHLTTNNGPPLRDAAVEVTDGVITYVGSSGDAPAQQEADWVDCDRRAVIPGFVDAHTHLVFAGDRSEEFSMRMAGSTYQEIAAAGGGIISTVAATRMASEDELYELANRRVTAMAAAGTTTLEIKSGYGLDLDTELRILRVARRLGAENDVDIKTTFLGAHSVPPEYQGNREGYIELIIEEMLPEVSGLADYCDVFVEQGVFDVTEARAIFETAAEHGMRARVHAEQLSHSGGAILAADISAASADHLDHANPDDAAALAAAGVAAVLVPGASRMLRSGQAPGPMLWDAGCVVALASDCNPGTSYYESMLPIIGLGVVEMGLTVSQAIWAATRGGAQSLGMADRGVIEVGARGDLLIIDAPSPDHIPYRPASQLIGSVVRAGDTSRH